MEKLYYDLHIHSCLSPCGDNENTPNNIVNMSLLKELDVIAIADHNSCLNVEACQNVAKDTNLIIIPAMEVTTSEDIHVLCYFKDLESAKKLGETINERMLKIKNDERIFGQQLILSGEDEIIGKIENLLIVSSNIGIYEINEIVENLGGKAVPAHINKDANSILATLGEIDDFLGFKTLEIYRNFDDEKVIKKFRTLKNSDAHMIENISERQNYLDVEGRNLDSFFKKI